MTTTFSTPTELTSMTLGELWEELIWLQDQPLSRSRRLAFNECLQAIQRRQDLIEDWNEFLAG